jgi:hypothetical protein
MILYIVLLIIAIVSQPSVFGNETAITIEQSLPIMGAKPLFVGMLSQESNSYCDLLAPLLQADLERSGQFTVTLQRLKQPKTTHDIELLFDQGYSLVIFLNELEDALEWRLYDATQVLMIKGKKCFRGSDALSLWSERIAQGIWQELMGDMGSFTSKIAYTKKTTQRNRHQATEIWVCDSAGRHHELLVANNKIQVAPYWVPFQQGQLLFSEFTPSNVRLMSYSLKSRKLRPLWDLPGTVAGISFGKDGQECIYGRSGGIWHYKFDAVHKQGKHQLVLKERGICSSPCLLPSGAIAYGCQGTIKLYNPVTNKITCLTENGYCVAPSYSATADSLLYSKEVKGVMQLYIYSFASSQHQQLTCDAGNKIDASWSPCGQYVVYCCRTEIGSSIVIMHIITKKLHRLTKTADYCSYPAWSPIWIPK